MARLVLLALALGGTARAADAGAATSVDRTALEQRLRAREPSAGQNLRELGPGVEEALLAIGRDPKADPLVRGRAVSALAYFPSRPARRFLETMIGEKLQAARPEDRQLSRKAALALAWMGGSTTPDRIAPLLQSPEVDTRMDAVLALGVTRLPQAAALLRTHRETEADDRVRAQIDRQLRAMETSADPAEPTRRRRR